LRSVANLRAHSDEMEFVPACLYGEGLVLMT
jgi:hypothetical protein